MKIILLMTVSMIIACAPTMHTKTIELTKDSYGKIIQTVETESIIQQMGQQPIVTLEHLKK